jgi:hypothetical protein
MHRSGTSAMTGALAHLGCAGPLTPMRAEADNPRGFFESRRVGDLNNDFLTESGSSWHDWRPLDLQASDSPQGDRFREAAAKLIEEEFGGADLIVLKDPRICRLVPVWTDALERQGYRTVPLLIHRDPYEVAQSLRTRNGFPLAFGLLLWLRHVLDAERLTRGRPRAFTSYGRVLADWRAVVGALGDRLGVAFPLTAEAAGPAVDEFLSAELRHFATPPEDGTVHPVLSDRVRVCFEIMERWAADGEDIRDHEALDRVEAALAEAGWTFVDVAGPRNLKVERLDALLQTARKQVTELEARIAEQARWHSIAERMLVDAQGTLTETLIRNRQLEEDHDRQVRELAVLAHLLRDAEQQYRTVVGSSSWRVTAPLRRLAGGLRAGRAALRLRTRGA